LATSTPLPAKNAFYSPILSDWQNHGAWEESGSLTATQRATKVWQKALEEYVEPVLEPGVREALDQYVAVRKQAIGDGEP